MNDPINPMNDSVSQAAGASPDLRRKKAGFFDAAPKIDRLPPHSPEAEQGVLGCVLLSPNDCMGECVVKFKSGPEVFYDLRHAAIYEVLVEMYDQREAIDLITLQQRLKDKNRLEEVGGLAYLSSLPDMVPSAANLAYYLDIVHEKHTLRKLIHTCTEVIGRVYEHDGAVEKLLDEVERDVMAIRGVKAGTQAAMKELIPKTISTIEEYHARQGKLIGLSTSLPDLDKITGGLCNGDMIVIAARPSMGKTSLAFQIAEHVAVEEKVPVGVLSLEMTKESLALRALCSRARVNFRSIREGFLAERDFPKLTVAAVKLNQAPIYIDDESGISIMQLRAKARRMVQAHGIKLLVIDYLQLLHATTSRGRRVENRQQEITEISSGVKAVAKELNIPVIVLSQLNRDLERDRSRMPRLSDLRESGSIEQDADVVAMLFKIVNQDGEESGNGVDDNPDIIDAGLLIAKQRNGPTGEVLLTFLKSYTRFEGAAKISGGDLPDNKP